MQTINGEDYIKYFDKKVKEYKKKYSDEIVTVGGGLHSEWEYKMLSEIGAIRGNAVVADGYVVRDKNDGLLYHGTNKTTAEMARDENRGSFLTNGSHKYSLYLEYKDYLKQNNK